jgi:hypothetical protein
VHIVRCFENPDVVHIGGTVDPIRDIEIVNTELLLADLETVEKRIEKFERQIKTGDKSTAGQLELSREILSYLAKGIPIRRTNGLPQEFLKEMNLLTAKKVLYVANISENLLKHPQNFMKEFEKYALREGSGFIAICGDLESEIAELPDNEKKVFLEELGITESGLDRLIRAGYALLDLITFYTTAGPELRAWTIKAGTHAPEAAGRIHSDMERGFIRAEVIHFDEFMRAGSMAAAKEKGWIRSEGKSYIVQDGDIILFRFNI